MKRTLLLLVLAASAACSSPDPLSTTEEDLNLGRPHPLPCAVPPVIDPCDCRFAASTCGPSYVCAVDLGCQVEGGGGIPFSYENDENPGYAGQCVMVNRSAGLVGCVAVGEAWCCP